MEDSVLSCVCRAIMFPILPEVGFDPGTAPAKFITIARVVAAIALTILFVPLAIISVVLDATIVGSPAGLAVGICALVTAALATWLVLPLGAAFKWSFSRIR